MRTSARYVTLVAACPPMTTWGAGVKPWPEICTTMGSSASVSFGLTAVTTRELGSVSSSSATTVSSSSTTSSSSATVSSSSPGAIDPQPSKASQSKELSLARITKSPDRPGFMRQV
jgi:hypothetical protein